MTQLPRRTVLRGAAGTLVLGAVAGCTGDDDDGNGGDSDSDSDGGDDGDGDPESRADSYLSDNNANGYESVEDHTGEDEVTVEVGAGSNDLAFSPAAIRVDTGTTIVWEWTGNGGEHNVVPADESDFDDFGQDERTEEAGHTTEDTFDEAGVALYVCQPHAAQGMHGAVIVE